MSLTNFYSLRNSFIVVGLTGRTGGGCHDICEILKSEINPFENFEIPNNLHVNEIQKFNICKNLLVNSTSKWRNFLVIKYRDVLLLFVLKELYEKAQDNFDDLNKDIILNVFNKLYDKSTVQTKRLGQDGETINDLYSYFVRERKVITEIVPLFKTLKKSLTFEGFTDIEEADNIKYLNDAFFGKYSFFAENLFQIIDKHQPVARQLFLQDVACNLRSTGQIYYDSSPHKSDAENVFTVAQAIKNLIKINRKASGATRIVIDSLKNSLEINFYRERYSGFYLIASNRDEAQVGQYIKEKINKLGFLGEEQQEIISDIKKIDEVHYKINDFKKGDFTSPDTENCIQKADYYIYFDAKQFPKNPKYNASVFRHLSLELQILKFLALIYKPGIVTPSAIERSMQLAFSSKYNSGCISRQVGAVVTDSNYSVKSVGWNEVPQGQTPCSLRNLKELVQGERTNVYSEYEKKGGNYSGKTFKEKVTETLMKTYGSEDQFLNNLEGHNCPYCFKELHNAFEGKENQVHTRSLHAEENAMLQISKFGGQPLNGGILFTTASPCELCSKKAFQLGIEKIFYIDPYPGIAKEQILKAGNSEKYNPHLFMFQGAVGRGYFKLYEPHMSIKDETFIRSGIKPDKPDVKISEELKNKLRLNFPDDSNLHKIETYEELLNEFTQLRKKE